MTVTVQVPTSAALVRRSSPWALGVAFPLLGMFAIPFGIGRRRGFKPVLLAALFFIGLTSTAAILGCGGGTHTTSTTRQPTNYTITVTATSGSVSHSTALTLTAQ